ncbi:MAG: SMC family ATPase [Gemmatimonadaceae bacterium]|nr:SMC family ATPase [Gemmatimonadaceae bacterium]
MRLHSLRLQNFRQHADTAIEFERGLTGVIGPNGAGKSTLLEAIAWALYGNAAARGTRDGIRNSRADGKAPVRVELDFELAGHRYRVVRGITTAECFLDGGDAPIASTIRGVTELLQKRLGMTRVEFFHTYFTGQKELDVMAALGPADRARFLSRVLGYDRLSSAQEIVRERRRALVAETNGLKQGMPDADEVQRRLTDVQEQMQVAVARAATASAAQRDAANDLQRVTPQWTAAQAERERVQQIMAELAVAENDAASLQRDVERLDRDVDAIRVAHDERQPLLVELEPLVDLRAQLTVFDALAVAESRRQALVERVRGVGEEAARLDERRTKLESAPALEQETQQQLSVTRAALTVAEQALEKERTAWVRDKQEAETRLESLRVQYTEFAQQRDTLEGLGEESPCPTCGRPLGASYRGVLDLVSEQLETVRVDGNYYRQRVEQLTKTPDVVSTLEDRRRVAQQEVASNERRLTKIQAALTELAGLDEQRRALDARLQEATAALDALPTGYNAAEHASVRASVARLADIETRAARLSGLLEREQATRVERERVGVALHAAQTRVTSLESQRGTGGLSEVEFAKVREAFDRAALTARRAELEAVAATAEVTRAQGEQAAAERRRNELARLQVTLERLDAEKRLHDELDRALTDLRTDLNFQLRPELSDIASRFLADLTDGRYNALEFDEDYALLVLEDGLPKPVISGGEEDLCNLVLRLAISQMIAERAGQAFSLLILDEVFGSLDDVRRGNVVDLLRRLNDRFEQVIVITHIEPVREGMDRVLIVRFDEARGMSTVTTGDPVVE